MAAVSEFKSSPASTFMEACVCGTSPLNSPVKYQSVADRNFADDAKKTGIFFIE